jgi:hypothetical protein
MPAVVDGVIIVVPCTLLLQLKPSLCAALPLLLLAAGKGTLQLRHAFHFVVAQPTHARRTRCKRSGRRGNLR